jgi:hypothetical protein
LTVTWKFTVWAMEYGFAQTSYVPVGAVEPTAQKMFSGP